MTYNLTKRIAHNGVQVDPKTVTLKTRSGRVKGTVTLIRRVTEHPIAGRATEHGATHRGRTWGVDAGGRTYTAGLGRGWTDTDRESVPTPVREALGIA